MAANAITLFCESHPELKLGPGPRLPDTEIIWFREGWAKIDRSDPNFDEKMRWVTAGGTPKIDIVPDDETDRVVATETSAHVCPKCGKAFRNEFSKVGHLRSHAPKA